MSDITCSDSNQPTENEEHSTRSLTYWQKSTIHNELGGDKEKSQNTEVNKQQEEE